MLRAVFVRTLKPGVTYEQFKDAWVPEGLSGSYPAKARVARNVANDRQVITIIEIDVPPAEFRSASASLTRPDSLASGTDGRCLVLPDCVVTWLVTEGLRWGRPTWMARLVPC